MKTVIELVKMATPNKALLKGKVKALVEGIEMGKITSRKSAISVLFSENADAQRSLNYLLRRAKKILAISVISSIKSEGELQKIYNEVHCNFASIMILIGASKQKTVIPEAKRIFQLAHKYEFVFIAHTLALQLSKYYAEVNLNKTLERKYSKLAQHYPELIHWTSRCHYYYTKIISTVNGQSSYTKGLLRTIEQAEAELEGHTDTAEMLSQYYTLKVIRCFALRNYARAALLSQQVLAELEQRPAAKRGAKWQFLSFRAIATIAAKRYDEAEITLAQAIHRSKNNIFFWQIFIYYQAINAIHRQRYYKAKHLQEEAARRKQSRLIKEYWRIVEAYLFFIDPDSNIKPSFRLGRFFNQTLKASQDKGGHNVNIILLDLLISLRQNRDRFLDRIEAVRTYRYRYLKGKAHERVRFLLDLLFLLPRHDFNLRRVERAGIPIQRKLSRRDLYANHNLEIEIVPFEHLWDRVLVLLGKKNTDQAVDHNSV